ncbi:hypothetical protein HY441_02025 [Candidatus Microgenomates bacterium]|nr:hypothetical protein [Candidatus Microgenomates bacterium]
MSVTQPNLGSKILVALLIVASLLVIATMALGLLSKRDRFVNDNQYQAVFLSNGQVYFGQLSGLNDKYVVLENIYYLQQDQNQQVQSGDNQNQQTNVSLVKLGNELHGPEDQMFIARDQILFWENLKADGKVSQAIKNQKQQ